MAAQLKAALAGTQVPAVAALEIVDGRIARSAVQGLRRSDATEPVRSEDPWLIGSNAKPMTAALLARLVDQGRLAWDTPLAEQLPELKAQMHPAYREITLSQMLSHRAGLPENVSDMAFFNRFYTDPRPLPEQRLAYVAQALTEAPVHPPGSTFSYSNTGYILAAVLAERREGLPFEALFRRELAEPLGLRALGYGPPPAGAPQGHSAGHTVRKAEDSNPLMFVPAGNLHLSLDDWAAFCLDQLAGARGQGRLLSADSYRRMQSEGAAGTLGWGWRASLAGRSGPVLMHAGSDGNWYALVALFPRSGRGALAVVNAGPDMGGDQVAQAALTLLLPPKE
ncbi:MAG: serine hydrolase domain-containing protein [Inhella sp.]